MAICFPFIKYIFLSCLFIVAFIATYNQQTAIIGYASIFVLQTILSVAIFLDIIKDSGRSMKSLYFPNIPNSIGVQTEISVPIWWILIIGGGLQFVAALLTIITCSYLYKRFRSIKISRDNNWRLSIYRTLYIICTILMILLVYMFLQFPGNVSGYYRMLLVVSFAGIIGCSIADIIYANNLSKLIGSTTDG